MMRSAYSVILDQLWASKAKPGFESILLKKSLLLCSKPFDSLINMEMGDLAMMGTQEASKQLFYDFDWEAHVPAEPMLRQIDHFLDVGAVREHLKAHFSHLGRPSIDPQLIVRMLVNGYTLGIRSERRLCEDVHLNLAYRWFL